MNNHAFFELLQKFLSGDSHLPVSFENLSSTEGAMVKQIENEFMKNDNFSQYSKLFLHTLDSSERFSEAAIRALSAIVKIGHLGETIRDVHIFCRHMAAIFIRELGFENCLILLRRPDTGKLRLEACSAKGDKYPASGKQKKKCRAMLAEDIALLVANSGNYIHIPDHSCPK